MRFAHSRRVTGASGSRRMGVGSARSPCRSAYCSLNGRGVKGAISGFGVVVGKTVAAIALKVFPALVAVVAVVGGLLDIAGQPGFTAVEAIQTEPFSEFSEGARSLGWVGIRASWIHVFNPTDGHRQRTSFLRERHSPPDGGDHIASGVTVNPQAMSGVSDSMDS
jgi:hypothetical protein